MAVSPRSEPCATSRTTRSAAPRLVFLQILVLVVLQHSCPSVNGQRIQRVRFGYFTEARPSQVACARGWFDLYVEEEDVLYQVECYPQSSGGFAASKLDNLQLDIANLGSTPWAQAAARGVDGKVVYINQYQGDAQGIYVRPSNPATQYTGIETPFDLRGRTIATPFGSTMHYQILFLIDLLSLTGSVNVVDMSPTEVMNAWVDDSDPPLIDAAGVWGTAKEFILSDNNGFQPAKVLMSARVLADWGRPTFVVVVATRTFSKAHPKFLKHVIGVMSKLNDSFLDRLGGTDIHNIQRWDASQPASTSLVGSLVDSLMKNNEPPGQPSAEEKFAQRRNLELFVQQSAQEQISCDFLGPGIGQCQAPTLQHIATRQTAEFLVQQKIMSELGPLDKLTDADGACTDADSLCGGDVFDGSILYDAVATCTACLPVGRYSNRTPPVDMDLNAPDYLIAANERMDNVTNRSPFALYEIGRAPPGMSSIGNSTCVPATVLSEASNAPLAGRFGDGADGLDGRSYSDNLSCRWAVLAAGCESDSQSEECRRPVEVRFDTFRLWSGDFVRIHKFPDIESCKNGTGGILIGQVSGVYDEFPPSIPSFRARGCLTVTFSSDGNQDRVYGANIGDGFVASYNRNAEGCASSDDCNGNPCIDALCECGGLSWGADCSETATCLGINTIRLVDSGPAVTLKSARSVDPAVLRDSVIQTKRPVDPFEAYPNDLDCTFQLISNNPSSLIRVDIWYDLEPSHDLIWLQRGSPETSEIEPYMVLTGTHKDLALPETYHIPTDENGVASLRLVTDARGRRRGFVAIVQANGIKKDQPICDEVGATGQECEIPHCAFASQLLPSVSNVMTGYSAGRVVSQAESLGGVRAMPWTSDGGCQWKLPSASVPPDTVAIRLVFNKPLDLEAHPDSAVGDKLQIRSTGVQADLFIERCSNDESCSQPWQTGTCSNDKSCAVENIVELEYGADITDLDLALVTDRNDGNQTYNGLDFDVLFVAQCPVQGATAHCVTADGECVGGYCMCDGGKPCNCPCDTDPPLIRDREVNRRLIVGIVVPTAVILIAFFLWYRAQRRKKSRALKMEKGELEAKLKRFEDSVVGMKAVIRSYIPQKGQDLNGAKEEQIQRVEKAIWCWKESPSCMKHHNSKDIYGNADDCWIKYGELENIEMEKNYEDGNPGCSPRPGYQVDFASMQQINSKTGYKRKVARHTEIAQVVHRIEDVDLSNVLIGGDNIPKEIRNEPQMIVVRGDIIQVSKNRNDGWAFGTKLHHADETHSRSLLHMAIRGMPEDGSVYTDTGWFPVLETTRVPTTEDLAVLQSNVGDTDVLAPPPYWDKVNDKVSAERYELFPSDDEAREVGNAFFATLGHGDFPHQLEILSVERIQNLAMWQSYVVKRQTMCHRELDTGEAIEQPNPERRMKQAMQRFERRWLWHSTNVESIEKILQQGFNRSFCGKNATMYGKGVYFARDASYSAHQAYAVADSNGRRYMMACRVMVGEYCLGRLDALAPDVRDEARQFLYDSTVGLRSGDTMDNPSIYVTYHDAQAYPEYLITFRYVNEKNDMV